MSHVIPNELAARDSIISEMKGAVVETEQKMEAEAEGLESEKRTLEIEKKELGDMRAGIEKAQKELDSFKRKEKDKRLKMEERIKNQVVKEGLVVLECGAVVATPQQIQSELVVRSQQLHSTLETAKGLSVELKKRERESKVKDSQLETLRHKEKMRKQNERRQHQRKLKAENTRFN